MEDIKFDPEKLKIQSGTAPVTTPTRKDTRFLSDLDNQKVAQVFADLLEENRQVIFPIGFPQAGKTQLISSLMFYAIKGKDKNAPIPFRTDLKIDFPYNQGRVEVDRMIRYYERKELAPATTANTLNLIGIDIRPDKSKLPVLKLALLDVAGEDVQKIKIEKEGRFTKKIDAILGGLSVSEAPVIFVLITPFKPPVYSDETPKMAEDREDTLHFDFLNYITEKQPDLLKRAVFFIIVSQWDKKPSDEKQTVESYIKTKRQKVYNYIKNTNVIWGEYSIGKILPPISNDDGTTSPPSLERINLDYPSKFWKKLYQICTNKDLDNKSFLQKLFD